jgi:hypothetical protein
MGVVRCRADALHDRYTIRYAIKRLIRYAKYAAVGAVVAVIGGGLLGTLGSGLAFFAAPSVGMGMAIGVITAIAKVWAVLIGPTNSFNDSFAIALFSSAWVLAEDRELTDSFSLVGGIGETISGGRA